MAQAVSTVASNDNLNVCQIEGGPLATTCSAAPKQLRAQVSNISRRLPSQIRDETGSRIRVVEGIPQCDERVIVISAPDAAPEEEHNAAQVGPLAPGKPAPSSYPPMASIRLMML